MKVELIDRSNGDLLAVNSARVSMAKHHDTFDPDTDRRLLAYLARENHFTPYTHARMTIDAPFYDLDLHSASETHLAGFVFAKYRDGDGLLRIKARHSVWGWAHWLRSGLIKGEQAIDLQGMLGLAFPESCKAIGVEWPGAARILGRPFTIRQLLDADETDPRFIDVTFRLTAPIPVVRQIQKTMVGLALNEVSRRYVDEAPTFDTPVNWRARPAGNIKQGSSGALNSWKQAQCRVAFGLAKAVSRICYNLLLGYGVAPEQARWALLQAMETQGYFTYSLATLKRLHDLRADGHAQAEAGEVVRQMSLAVACSDVAEVWVNQ
ncbi:MAG: FAD-dependent thymidylate synthase [Pseudomonas sp.]